MDGERLIAKVEATDPYKAMKEFKSLMRNTWCLIDPLKIRIVLTKG